MSARADVCVIGGGIAGLAVAFELVRRGRGVVVLEAAAVGERAAAGVAAGMLAPVAEADIAAPELTRLALASHGLYPEWVDAVERASGESVGFDRVGTLFVALHHDHLAQLRHLEGFQRERGLHTERIGAVELRTLEPLLAPNVVGGLHLRDDFQVDPRRLLHALVGGLAALGGTVVERAPARAVVRVDGGWQVRYERAGVPATLRADVVVLAAGAWTGEVATPAPPLPLRAVKGQLLRLRGDAASGGALVRHVVRTPDVYLVPRADGELVVGATMEEQGFDSRVTAGAVYDLLREARRVLPGVTELTLAETNVGFRPALRDHLPAIGAAGPDGMYVAAGHFRNGVELAPITGRLLADLICDGRADPLLAALSPARFAAAGSGANAPTGTTAGTKSEARA